MNEEEDKAIKALTENFVEPGYKFMERRSALGARRSALGVKGVDHRGAKFLFLYRLTGPCPVDRRASPPLSVCMFLCVGCDCLSGSVPVCKCSSS